MPWVCPKIVGSPVGQAVNGLAEVAKGAEAPSPCCRTTASSCPTNGTRVAQVEKGALAPHPCLSLAVYGQAKRPAAQPDKTGTHPDALASLTERVTDGM